MKSTCEKHLRKAPTKSTLEKHFRDYSETQSTVVSSKHQKHFIPKAPTGSLYAVAKALFHTCLCHQKHFSQKHFAKANMPSDITTALCLTYMYIK